MLNFVLNIKSIRFECLYKVTYNIVYEYTRNAADVIKLLYFCVKTRCSISFADKPSQMWCGLKLLLVNGNGNIQNPENKLIKLPERKKCARLCTSEHKNVRRSSLKSHFVDRQQQWTRRIDRSLVWFPLPLFNIFS